MELGLKDATKDIDFSAGMRRTGRGCLPLAHSAGLEVLLLLGRTGRANQWCIAPHEFKSPSALIFAFKLAGKHTNKKNQTEAIAYHRINLYARMSKLRVRIIR